MKYFGAMFGRSGSMSFPMTYDYFPDGFYSSKQSLSPLEKMLSIALALVGILAIGLMIAVVILGLKLNEDTYKPVPTVTESTKYPPWVTSRTTTTTTSDPPSVSSIRPTDTLSTTTEPVTGSTDRTRPTDTLPTTTEPVTGSTERPRPTWPPSETPALHNNTLNSWDRCTSQICHEISLELKSQMNLLVNPCKDFEQFSNGLFWEEKVESEKSQAEVLKKNLYADMRKIIESEDADSNRTLGFAKMHFNACLNATDEGIETTAFSDWLTRFLTNESLLVDEDKSTWLIKLLAKIRKNLNGNYIFSMRVDVNDEDKEKNVIYVDHADFGIAEEYLHHNELTHYKSLLSAYWKTFYPSINEDSLDLILNQTIEFEHSIYQLSWPYEKETSEDLEIQSETEILSTLDQSGSGPVVDDEYWLPFVNAVLKGTLEECRETFTNCEAQEMTSIVVNNPTFFNRIGYIFNTTKTSIIENYLKTKIMLQYGTEFSEQLRKLHWKGEQEFHVASEPFFESRENYCLDAINTYFGFEISKKYTETYPNPHQFHNAALGIVESVRKSFLEFVEEFTWIETNETKSMISERIRKLKVVVGFPEFDEDWNVTLISSGLFDTLHLTSENSYLENTLELIGWKTLMELKTYYVDYESERIMKVLMSPMLSHPVFYHNYHLLYYPVGLFQSSSHKRIQNNTIALNYGSLGYWVAKGFMKVLHETGTEFGSGNANGSIREIWDIQSHKNLTQHLLCIYQKFVKNEEISMQPSMMLNMLSKLKKLIAMKVAHRAYIMDQNYEEQTLPNLDFSPEELFFISLSQTEGPNAFKISSPEFLDSETMRLFEMTEEFESAWGCSARQQIDIDECGLL